jgi:hypothetical protein
MKELQRLTWTIIACIALVALVAALTGCTTARLEAERMDTNGVRNRVVINVRQLLDSSAKMQKILASQGTGRERLLTSCAGLENESATPFGTNTPAIVESAFRGFSQGLSGKP